MLKYFYLLKSNPFLRRLSLIQLLCYFGAWFSHMAIYTLLIDLNAPIWAISTAAAFGFLPAMILAPFSGSIIDKLETKPLMITLISVEIVTVFLMIFIDSLDMIWIILALIFLRMGSGGIYFQAEMTLLPKLLNQDDLKLANEIHSMIWSLSYAIGMAIAGFYVHYFGVKVAFLTDVFIFFIGLFLLLGVNIPSLVKEKSESVFVMIKSGFNYLKNNRKILHLIILHSCVGLTAYDALIALLADIKYASILSVPLSIGFINATRAFSLVLGQFVLSKFVNEKTLFSILILQGVGIFLWAFLQENLYISIIGILMAGFFTTTLWSYTYTLLQVQTDKKYYGRVIAYNDMFFMAVSTLVSFLIGFLYEFGLSLQNITLLLGLFFVFFAYYWKWIKSNFVLHVKK